MAQSKWPPKSELFRAPYYTFSRTCQIEPNSKNKKHIGSTDFSQSCPKLKENHHCQRAANVHPKSITRIKELLWLCQVQKGQSIEFNDENLLAMSSLKGQPIWEKLLLAEPPNGQSVWIEVGQPNCNRPPEEEKTDHLTTSRVCWIKMKRCWALQGQHEDVLMCWAWTGEALNSIDLLGYNKLKSTQPNKSITNLNKEEEAMSTNSEQRVDPNLNEKEWQQVKPYDESAKVWGSEPNHTTSQPKYMIKRQ